MHQEGWFFLYGLSVSTTMETYLLVWPCWPILEGNKIHLQLYQVNKFIYWPGLLWVRITTTLSTLFNILPNRYVPAVTDIRNPLSEPSLSDWKVIVKALLLVKRESNGLSSTEQNVLISRASILSPEIKYGWMWILRTIQVKRVRVHSYHNLPWSRGFLVETETKLNIHACLK